MATATALAVRSALVGAAVALAGCGETTPGTHFATIDECVTDTWVSDWGPCRLCGMGVDTWDTPECASDDCVNAMYWVLDADTRVLELEANRSASRRTLSAVTVDEVRTWSISAAESLLLTVGRLTDEHPIYCDDVTLVLDGHSYGRASDAQDAAIHSAWDRLTGTRDPTAWHDIAY